MSVQAGDSRNEKEVRERELDTQDARASSAPLPSGKLSRRLAASSRDITGSISPKENGASKDGRQPTPAEWMRAARLAQGLPPVVTDPVVLHNVRTIMRAGAANKIAEVIPLRARSKRIPLQLDTNPHPDQPSRDVAL